MFILGYWMFISGYCTMIVGYSVAFSVDMVQMLEMNVAVTIPTAPFLTVVLAFIGKYRCHW